MHQEIKMLHIRKSLAFLWIEVRIASFIVLTRCYSTAEFKLGSKCIPNVPYLCLMQLQQQTSVRTLVDRAG